MKVETVKDGYLITPQTAEEEAQLQQFIENSQKATVEAGADRE